jgi:acetate kinase
MKFLVINCGSSSIKYRLYDLANGKKAAELAKGLIERIGSDRAQIHHQLNSEQFDREDRIKDYHTGIAEIADHLRKHGVLRDDLAGIGHRVVHGAEAFRQSVIIDQQVRDQIEKCGELAPLHNPANLSGIQACEKIFPGISQVAVFDTAFFHTLEPSAYLYALPYEWYEQYRIRRYGFHGTSHHYVAERAAEFLNKPLAKCNLITLHLGNGCSMAAVRQGQAVNTTMGLTPLEGLVMGTRCGDIDTAIVFHLLRVTGMTVQQVHQNLEKKSGLLGISGVSRDMRDVSKAANDGHERAKLALDIFARRARKYIGAYLTDIGPCDAVVFTGGIGENAWQMREMILTDLDHLGIKLDREKNRNLDLAPTGAAIHAGSQTAVLVIPTNEELAIARDTFNLVSKLMPKEVK